MPVQQDERVRSFGTRVRLFPQTPTLSGFGNSEVVWLSLPAGSVGPGPSDNRLHVVDAIDKPEPYSFPYLPPFHGPTNPPVRPDSDGHFDYLPVDSREFLAVHLYGSLRRVLDIFESYLGQVVPWHFQDTYPRLEVIPLIDWDNAQSGYGFMEFGYATDYSGRINPFALNFDVIAHEIGHCILFSLLDFPLPSRATSEFSAFHEASADLVALVASMHFETVLDRLLHASKGNLYMLNELNRIGEISDAQQIRIASNSRKMTEVSSEVHDLSRPLTGAFFDILMFFYIDELVRRQLINRWVRDQLMSDRYSDRDADRLHAEFSRGYTNRHFQFKAALTQARDMLGFRLVETWRVLSPNDLRFADVATAFLAVDQRMTGRSNREALLEIFHWRDIYEIVNPVWI
jgi:hypothetical protein